MAGLVLSFLLSKKQIPHVLVGRQEKGPLLALGETLPPSALPMLQSMALLPLFEKTALRKTTGYHSFWGRAAVSDHNFYFNRPFQHGLKLNKAALLQVLEEKQMAHIQHYERSISISLDGNPNATLDGITTLEAKLIVDATGRKRQLCKSLDIEQIEGDDLMAFSCHQKLVKLERLPHGVYVEAFEKGWGIVSQLDEERQVMSLFTRKEFAQEFSDFANWEVLLKDTLHLKHYLGDTPLNKLVGARANTSRPVKSAGPQWLAIGDAAMAFDPLSSHGITSGVYTALQAVGVIEAQLQDASSQAFSAYDAQLKKIYSAYYKQKLERYRQEQRWKEAPFWQAMSQVPVGEEVFE